MIEDGKTVDEALEADALAEYAEMSWNFISTERMVRQVYRSLAEE